MATARQVAANRRNAVKSTGPRIPEGKAVSSRNATLAGLFWRHVVLSGAEEPAEFQTLLDSPRGDFQPAAAYRPILVTRYARQLWRSQRITRIELALAQTHESAMAAFWGAQPRPDDPGERDEIAVGSCSSMPAPGPLRN